MLSKALLKSRKSKTSLRVNAIKKTTEINNKLRPLHSLCNEKLERNQKDTNTLKLSS